MNMTNKIASFVFAFALLGFTACTEQAKHNENTETTVTATETDKAYVCPMHCEGSASDQPGKCPVCGMDLEKNKDFVAPVSASADTSQTGTISDTTATK